MNEAKKSFANIVHNWLWIVTRITKRYYIAHKRFPNLISPRRFTEKLQWRKLFDRNPLFQVLSDKVAVRAFIESRVGSAHLVPCLWMGNDPDAIPIGDLPAPYIIKSAHGSSQCILVIDAGVRDDTKIREVTRSWLDHCHGSAADEPGYIGVPRRLIVEKLLLNEDGSAPLELKAYVFDGKVRTFQSITIDQTTRERFRAHYTADWKPLNWALSGEASLSNPLPRPHDLEDVIIVAERLGAGLDHVRVDMYLSGPEFYVGEMTLYSQSGLLPFTPDEADHVLGAYWSLHRPFGRAWRSMIAGGWGLSNAN